MAKKAATDVETAPVKEEAAETKKKTTRTTTSRTAKKAANIEVYIQYWGKEVNTLDVVAAVKKLWTEEMGKKESDLKDLKIYVKPEDDGAHYVINDEITGFIRL